MLPQAGLELVVLLPQPPKQLGLQVYIPISNEIISLCPYNYQRTNQKHSHKYYYI